MARPIPAPVFESEARLMRPPRLRDAWQLTRILRGDPALLRFVPTGDRMTPWIGLSFVVQSWLGRRRGRRLDYLTIDKATGDITGCWMTYRITPHPPRSCEIGVWRVRGKWGTRWNDGLGNHIYRHLYRAVGIHRVISHIDPENIGAMRSTFHGKRNWTYEGTLRHAQYHHGALHDMRAYSRLATDPEEQRMVAELDAADGA